MSTALIAARNGKKFVQKEDFMNAVDRIVGGLEKRSKITTEEERKCIANHEVRSRYVKLVVGTCQSAG